ncbi:MAG: SprT-like domain-containing protein [SAR324 cluster bacterium]|nr:SprT-like domain-containing protein [SAR324 cluster bacterium]
MVNNKGLNPSARNQDNKGRLQPCLETKQDTVLQEAHCLMEKYGLIEKGWKFRFDNAKIRAGQCRYDKKEISISKNLANQAPASEITDTLLHEIAHALVGKRGHHHEWKRTAISIGCNGNRCHSLQFTQPKYIQQCEKGCWERQVHRRQKNLICRFCRSKVIYHFNE